MLTLNARRKQSKCKTRYILYFLLILHTKSIYTEYPTYTMVNKSAFNYLPLKLLKEFFNEKCISDFNFPSKLSILSRFRLKKNLGKYIKSLLRDKIRNNLDSFLYFLTLFHVKNKKWFNSSCTFETINIFPAGIYLFKVQNKNTRTRCEIRSEVTIKTPEQHQ